MKSPNDKERFLEILAEIPLISIAAKKAGISRSTIYRWRETDIVFDQRMDQVLEEGISIANDRVESVLYKKALQGEQWSVKMWLENNCMKYIKPRMPINSYKNDGLYDIDKIEITHLERKYTDEKTKEMEDELERLRKIIAQGDPQLPQ